MRILRFITEDGAVRWGRAADDGAIYPMIGDPFGDHRFAEIAVRPDRLLAPVDPPNIFGIGRNYREHAREMNASAESAEPLVFLKATTAVIGPDEPIVLPTSAPDEVDYEAELAVVIGRRARDVTPTQAMQCVFGYTCANDVTARDCQKRRDLQWARAKGFDTFCSIGPALVTADALDPAALPVRCTLNGEPMQDGNTAEMIFSVPALIAYLSRQFTLLPGTVILTGTPPGVGAARKPPVYLRPGDQVRVEIEGIGSLSNPVIAAE